MDVYQAVTDRIIGLIESGTIPWRKTWAARGGGMPKNLVSRKEYRGINSFLLSAMPYSSTYWLTYKQATDLGGHVRKGEKSSLVIFWRLLDKHDQDDDTKATGRIPLLKHYNLFSAEQCENIPIPPDPEEAINPFTPIERAEQIVAGYKGAPNINYGGTRAFYRPSEDRVQMPHKHTFERSEDFYQVLLHELSHSTGHQSRLARKEVMERNEFGSDDYSAEEICTELSASMLCAVAGISNETIELSASYINGWLSVLRQDKKAIVIAAARAQASADHILGRKFGEEEPE